eukprot:CAMPEP_0201868202 /NCGR_PEP_ID=MMETSP0902-20130614/2191_1 /ASSEMBLY_ACC=CAM_ASM_000551 /TAXON_ID=420261 /ORGANISM="Thalassiosira antarctica, Strain CCMP982" /LENGTH=721 /DNA_ID=CAMNT_0048393519 /DNA_START=46 /DNA_END=2211 /DNA_ORIENTATION=-
MDKHQLSNGQDRPAATAADLDRTEHRTNYLSEAERGVPPEITYPRTDDAGVGGGENDSLLKKYHGGTATANGASNGARPKSPQPSSILKPSSSYGGTSTSMTRSTSVDTGGNVVIPSLPAEQQRTRRPRSQSRGASLLRQSGASLRSMLSIPGAGQPVLTDETIVLAPGDSLLPTGTQLHGSSKLAANAIIRAELKKQGRRESDSDCSTLGGNTINSVRTARTLQEIEAEYLAKTQTTFYNDAMTFAEGTIPQSIVIATVIGVVCGVVAYMYYYVLDYFLELFWQEMPKWIVIGRWPEHLYVLWIPLVTFSLSICCGLSVYYLGEPGDLAYTIQCVHTKGYKDTSHIIPMVASSLFSILAGASLGPEAPLVAICAATAGFLSRKVFKQTNRNVVRKHTFMGMAGALAAFFGVPLGGSIFALEVTSRFGVEYFEHMVEAIFAGEICVVVFRSCAGLPLEQIWKISPTPLIETEPYMIVLGGAIGLLGAGTAFIWANFHWRLMDFFRMLGLLDDENTYAVPRVLLGACGVVIIGMLVPQTMFWGEFEVGVLATLSPASELPHVWPTTGLIGFEMDSALNCLIVGFAKLMVISFTVAGGYRGGYIFPFFAAGAAFGRALCFVFPTLSPVIACLCFAAGINVAITRTALATSLILAFLAGEQFALPAVLAASVVSLFATGYVPFIKSQLARSDIDFSLYYQKNRQPKVQGSVRTLPADIDMTNED